MNDIKDSSEQTIVLTKHLEDMLKELYLMVDEKQANIQNLHKRMYKKLREIKKKVIDTNAKINEFTNEVFDYDIHKDDYRSSGI